MDVVLREVNQSLRNGTYSEKPFHFSRYSTCPLTTRLSSTFSTTYSSSSSEEELSAVRLVFFPMSHSIPPEELKLPDSCKMIRKRHSDSVSYKTLTHFDGIHKTVMHPSFSMRLSNPIKISTNNNSQSLLYLY